MTHIQINVVPYFLISLFSVLCTTAQVKDVYVKGVVIDSISNTLIGDVSVRAVFADGDSVIGKTSASGMFLLDLPKSTDLDLTFTHLNYESQHIHVTTEVAGNIDLGLISLYPKGHSLKEVSITGKIPTVQRKIDRLTFNVQLDPDKDVYSVLEMMQKIPLISIDGQDNISLKGQSNFKLLINGKPSALFSGDPGVALKMMPAKDILRIEVITSPPAKYDAEGISGLINIVTQKRADDGYNVYFGASYNYPYGPLGSFITNIKRGSVQANVLVTASFLGMPENPLTNQIDYKNQSTTLQQGSANYDGSSTLSRGEILYQLDSLNLFSLSGSWKRDQYDMTSRVNNYQNWPATQSFESYLEGSPFWNTADIGLNYEKGFNNNPQKFLNLSYQYLSSSNESSDQLSYFGVDWQDITQHNHFGFQEHSFQLDYENHIGSFGIESGAKLISRNNKSRYGYGENINDGDSTFQLNYMIYNMYQSVAYEKDSWSAKAGVRLDLMDFSRHNDQHSNQFNILPTLAVQRTLNNLQTLNFSYDQRIERPNIKQLSPFENRSNPNFNRQGNPKLAPTKGHNFDLSYSYIKKLSIIASLGYFYTKNAIQEVYTASSDSILHISYQNIGKEQHYDSNIYIGYSWRKVNLTMNGQLSYVQMEGRYKGDFVENTGYEKSMSVNMSIPISETLRSNVSVRYTGPQYYLQGNSNAFTGYALSFTKQFFDKKLSVFASVNNPFQKYYVDRRYYNVPEFSSRSLNQRNYRSFVFALNYSFGRTNMKTKKVKKTISNEDQQAIDINPLK